MTILARSRFADLPESHAVFEPLRLAAAHHLADAADQAVVEDEFRRALRDADGGRTLPELDEASAKLAHRIDLLVEVLPEGHRNLRFARAHAWGYAMGVTAVHAALAEGEVTR